ncbi:hypothetical protein N9L01_00030 [bacterium]|jgi:hypothetical protein|nr:hypothetical protein [bacterium]
MDLNNLPADIAAQMTDDLQRLQAKAERLATQAENEGIMSLLPDARLPISYHTYWLDRNEGGWTVYITTQFGGAVGGITEVHRLSDRKITLKSAWPNFVRWVNNEIESQRNAVADSNVVVQDVSQVV